MSRNSSLRTHAGSTIALLMYYAIFTSPFVTIQCNPGVRTTYGTKLIGSINREFYKTEGRVFVTFCKRSKIKVSKNRDSTVTTTIDYLVSFFLLGDCARA